MIQEIKQVNLSKIEQLMSQLEAALSAEDEPTQTAPAVPEGQLTRDALKGMTPDQIDQARRDGRLNYVMGMDK